MGRFFNRSSETEPVSTVLDRKGKIDGTSLLNTQGDPTDASIEMPEKQKNSQSRRHSLPRRAATAMWKTIPSIRKKK